MSVVSEREPAAKTRQFCRKDAARAFADCFEPRRASQSRRLNKETVVRSRGCQSLLRGPCFLRVRSGELPGRASPGNAHVEEGEKPEFPSFWPNAALLGYEFRDKDLLYRCLTHASAARTRLESNERLEFLGDAVLGLTICRAFHPLPPRMPRGADADQVVVVVSRASCATLACRMGLEKFLVLGRGISGAWAASVLGHHGRHRSDHRRIYVDGGFDKATPSSRELFMDDILSARSSSPGSTTKAFFSSRCSGSSEQLRPTG